MIITRTPFRVSFFGGGTDYPDWYREYGGAVLATTIDKYCYLSCRELPPFFDTRYRTVYNKIELTTDVTSIEHPSVRACLDYLRFHDRGSEIVHTADLPARTGIGSSSSFTVGLLHALWGLRGVMPTKRQLAETAIEIEQNILKENVGSQDQVSAAFGGFNLVHFSADGFELRPVTLLPDRLAALERSLVLVYTGVSRFASEIAGHQIRNIRKTTAQLLEMRKLVDEALGILTSDAPIDEFGRLLHHASGCGRRRLPAPVRGSREQETAARGLARVDPCSVQVREHRNAGDLFPATAGVRHQLNQERSKR